MRFFFVSSLSTSFSELIENIIMIINIETQEKRKYKMVIFNFL